MSKKARDDWISVLESFQSYSILHLWISRQKSKSRTYKSTFLHPGNSNDQVKWFAVVRNNIIFLLVFREAIAQRQKSTDVSPAYYSSVFLEKICPYLYSVNSFSFCVFPFVNLAVTVFLLMLFTVLGYDLNSLHEFFIVHLNCLWPRQCWCRQKQSEWPGKNQTPRFYPDTTLLTKP